MSSELIHWFAPSLETVKKALASPDGAGGANQLYGTGLKNCIRAQLADGITLGVPLVGGNSVLKHKSVDFSKLWISDHGNWQRKHLGAWQAIYGKTPFYQHIFPKLEDTYIRCSQGKFVDFTEAILRIALDFLELDILKTPALEMRMKFPERFEQIREELWANTDPSLTIFDSIFHVGKSTAFLLL